ncbi:MAG: LptF/LptG family permease [Chitinispirillaceae bacterium]|nr:LptF/LptG family permease [Chitinispirillaceae bacterium]
MILYRYIIKELIFPFLASLSIIVFYFIMQQAVVLLDRIVSKGLDPRVVLEIFIIQLGWIIALAIPMAILTATLWTFGRMSGDNEITSIKASGQSMLPLLMPVFAGAAVFTVLLVFFNDLILPDANHRTANLLSDISRKRPAAFIEPKVLIRDFANYTIYAKEVNPRTGELKRVRIFSDMPGQDPSTTVAAAGIIRMTSDQQYLEFSLFDGETHSISRVNGSDHFLLRFEKQVVYIKNIDTRLERTHSSYRSDREMSSQAMLQEVRDIESDNEKALVNYRSFIDSLDLQIVHLDSLASALDPDSVSADTAGATDFAAWLAKTGAPTPAIRMKLQEADGLADQVQRRLNSNRKLVSQYMVEVHKKYAIAVACLVFVLIGAPLGIMARRGGLTVGASYSIFFFIAYWAFLIGGETLGDKLIVSPSVAMWTGNAVIGLCGMLLLILMLRETTIRFDAIIGLWNRIFGGDASFLGRLASSLPGRIISGAITVPKWLLKRTIGTLPMYLISLFTGYVFGLVFAFVAIFVVIDYVSNLKRFEHANIIEIARYYWYYLPWIIQITSPLVLLIASMFAIGKMAKYSEIIAMKAAGVGIRQLTVPLLVLGLLISAGTFYGGEKIIPQANLLRKELQETLKEPRDSPLRQQQSKRGKSGLREYRRNFYYFGSENIMYMFKEFGTSPQVARGVWRERFDSSSITERIQAGSMLYDSTGWRFIDALVRRFGDDGSTVTQVDTLRDTLLLSTPIDMVARIKSKEEMSYWELKNFIEAARKRGEKVRTYMGELEFKIALPFMNFIVILLGVALTARAGRKGAAVLFGTGLGLAFFYWLLSRFAIVFAQNGHLPTLLGAWIGNALFFILGLALYRKASQ